MPGTKSSSVEGQEDELDSAVSVRLVCFNSWQVEREVAMSSSRAEIVAEILYGLKKEDQYATLSSIARRAGFSPGANCRTIAACMTTIQKDWPHLEFWRGIHDDGIVAKNTPQAEALQGQGIELRDDGENWTIILAEEKIVVWETSLDGKAIPVKPAAG